MYNVNARNLPSLHCLANKKKVTTKIKHLLMTEFTVAFFSISSCDITTRTPTNNYLGIPLFD